ncbi:MAG: hypothetical protein EHM79_13955 [Geobacter sp.]|nr:MAG: hypothetical protein EHM79_13955 [Geobacter sp.]
MRFALLCILCGTILCFIPKTTGASSDTDEHLAELEIQRNFETTLDLWRDGRYEELYERTYADGSRSREAFIRRITAAARKPACCWEKLQEVSVSKGPGKKATLHARIGLESRFGDTEYSTRSFRMKQDNGVWKPAMSDILSLAGKAGR